MFEWIKRLFQKKEHLPSKKKRKQIDFQHLKNRWQARPKVKSYIDDITWHDLDMDDVFAKINYTVSSSGEEVLYRWLRTPLSDEASYLKRKELINQYGKNKQEETKLQVLLANIGYCKYDYESVIAYDFQVSKWMLPGFLALVLVNVSLIALSIINLTLMFLPYLLLSFAANMYIHYKFNTKYGSQVQALAYTFKLIRFCKKMKTSYEIGDSHMDDLFQDYAKKFASLGRKEAVILRLDGLDAIADYINIMFLIKEINFALIAGQVNKYQEDILSLYRLIGELDAVISINRYKDQVNNWCQPEFGSEDVLFIEDMYHPILKDPVTNTIHIHKGIAITGSNMSGKSTFLRTIGINTIFAQSLCFSLSKQYKGKFRRIVSSISLSDNLLEGKSYFLMEAEAIKRIVDLRDDDYDSLILIDELFKGTNPLERLAASMEILNELIRGKMTVLIATHDLQILPELIGYEHYYFTENVTKHTLDFDYKIRQGITKTRNAIKLMEFVRYPEYLTKRIHQRIDDMEEV